MVRIVCVVGYPGAGKSVAQAVAEDVGVETAAMGDQVRRRAERELQPILDADVTEDHLSQLDIDVREELQDEGTLPNPSRSDLIGAWASVQRSKYGKEVVAEWTADYIESECESETVLVDGVRSCSERDVFEQRFESVEVILVEAPFEVRLERLQERGRDGEDEFTSKDLEARDSREDEWGVDEVAQAADVVIENTGTLSEYKTEVRKILST